MQRRTMKSTLFLLAALASCIDSPELGDTDQALDGAARDRVLSVSGGGVRSSVQTGPSSPTFTTESLGGSDVRSVAVERNPDGRLSVFAVGGDGALYGRYQTTPGGPWNPEGWQSMGGGWITQVVTARNVDGRIEVFVLNQFGNVFHRFQITPGGGWNTDGWGSMGGSGVTQIAATRRADGRLEIAALGGDMHVYRRAQFAAGSGWDADWLRITDENLTSIAFGFADGRLDLFSLDTAGNVMRARENGDGTWNPYARIANGPVQQITVAHESDGRLVILAIDSGHYGYELRSATVTHVWDTYFRPLGWTGISEIAVAQKSNGTTIAFARKQEGSLYVADQSLTPGDWSFSPLVMIDNRIQSNIVAIDQQ